MSWNYDDHEFESSGIYDDHGNEISANSAYMSSEWEPSTGPLPTREEMWTNHGRIPRLDRDRPAKVPPEALRLVAEYMAGEVGYPLDELTAAVRPGRPSKERAARLDALGRIVLDLRTVPSGASVAPSHWHFHEAKATLEDIGEALGGLSRKAVERLQRRGSRIVVVGWKQGATRGR